MNGPSPKAPPAARRKPKHINPLSLHSLKRTIRLGVKSIWLHGLRSLLTVLGIVFGVCSVIAMLAVGEGASQNVQEQIRRLGSNNVIVQSVKPPEEQQVSGGGGPPRAVEYGLTYNDIRTIREILPSVKVVVPSRIIREYVWNLAYSVECEIRGTVPWYPEMRNHKVERGRFITDEEMEARLNVCVLGAEMVPILFPIDDPLGKSVKIRSEYYRVVGVMEPLGMDSGPGTEVSGTAYRLYIPLTAARYRFGETLFKRTSGSFESERVELHEAVIQVAEIDDVVTTAKIVDDVLKNSPRRKKPDYEIIVPLELLKNAEETKRVFNIVLGAIAGISLLVGGIGIMNIMLASVTERTREIGIRRALGAKKSDVVTQFLIETVILSGAGGLIGVVLGVSIPFFITLFSNMPTKVTLWSPLLAFSISALVGVVFGLYPATRAAEMDPVEALRHE